MEVILPAPKTFSSKKKTILPLSQLLEETKRTSGVSNHLLETRVYAKHKSRNVEADPSELHFSGFEVGKSYKKVLKLINISSEVLDVHILPTQTKFFSTEYTKKNRLVPGLSYTVVVHFRPNDWQYFFDSIRVHCKGEENLLVPVHAYPVIDDLHMPSHISLPVVPLGNSTSHVIPLSCSCPVDFEFQVHCLQSHEAFTVEPMSGIIPANGRTEFAVTFTPQQYGTAEITLQLVISQFNSKPFICTITALCSPYLSLSLHDKNETNDKISALEHKREVTLTPPSAPKARLKLRPSKAKTSGLDVSTPAGLVKMLIQHHDKIAYKDLQEGMSHNKTAHQTRQMKELAFENQVRVNAQKERENYLRWQVHLGEDLSTTEQKMNILKEQETAAAKYKTKRNLGGRDVDLDRELPKLLPHRVLRNKDELPDCTPEFYDYGSRPLEIRQRALRIFQQAVRKVILRCQVDNKLSLLRELVSRMKKIRSDKDIDGKMPVLKLSSEKLLPFMLPVFTHSDHRSELIFQSLTGFVHVRRLNADVTTTVPLFSLKVPQHHRLMGYQKVSVYEAGASYVPPALCRALRTGTEDKKSSSMTCPVLEFDMDKELQQSENPSLNFSAPKKLLKPPNAHPLRIFNPAPCVYAFKPRPLYLESDLDFHLCPLPRYIVSEGNTMGVSISKKDNITGTLQWILSSMVLPTSSVSTMTTNCTPWLSDPFDSSILPVEATIQDPDDCFREETLTEVSECTRVNLTPEMVQAEFEFPENPSSNPAKENYTDDRTTHEQTMESSVSSQSNELVIKVLARMKYLKELRQNMPKPQCHSSSSQN